MTEASERMEQPLVQIRKTARKAGLGRTLERRFGRDGSSCLLSNQVETVSRQKDAVVWNSVDRSGPEL